MAIAFLRAKEQGSAVLELDNVNLMELKNFTQGLYIKLLNVDNTKLSSWPTDVDRDSDEYILIKANNIKLLGTNLSLALEEKIVNAIVLSGNKIKYILQVKGVDNKLIKFDVTVDGLLQASASGDHEKEQAKKIFVEETQENSTQVKFEKATQEVKLNNNFTSKQENFSSHANLNNKQDVSNKPKSNLMFIIGAILVALLILAACIYFFLFKDSGNITAPSVNTEQATQEQIVQEKPIQEQPTQEQASQVVTQITCNLSDANDNEIIKACIEQKADHNALYTLANEAVNNNRCYLAFRLLISSARAGHIDSALSLARYYDPAITKTNSCFKKDAKESKYWYEMVLKFDANNQEALKAVGK